ncbi:MAG: hypothetical protein ACRDHG_10370 [Anaerolineales bacterium]
MATEAKFPRQLTVQRFEDARRVFGYGDGGGPLQLRIQAQWVRAAGFSEGDLVLISNPRPGCLLVEFAGRRVDGSA